MFTTHLKYTFMAQRGHSPKLFWYLVILCFERQFPKQSTVARVKSKDLASPKINLLRHYPHLALNLKNVYSCVCLNEIHPSFNSALYTPATNMLWKSEVSCDNGFMRLFEQSLDNLMNISEKHRGWNNLGGLLTCYNKRVHPVFLQICTCPFAVKLKMMATWCIYSKYDFGTVW